MISATEVFDDQQKELCAITVMRAMLEDYCAEKNVSFEEAILEFAASKAYFMLFDFTTGLWREGPDYLRDVFAPDFHQSASHIVTGMPE